MPEPFEEHENIRHQDRRKQAVTTITKEANINGTVYPIGTAVEFVSVLKFGNENINFGIPNMCAVYLDYAYKLHQESEPFFVYRSFPRGPGGFRSPNDYDLLMSALQKRIGSVIMAYCALETFTNDVIPTDFIYITKGGKKESKQIVESYKTPSKIYNVLPQLYGISGEIDDAVKGKFKKIQELRNTLAHLEEKDKHAGEFTDSTSIWYQLITKDFENYPMMVKDIMKYFFSFHDEDKIPRWFRKLPY